MDGPSYTASPMPGGGVGADKKSSFGSIVGAAIVILVLIFGGLYFWGSQLEQQQTAQEELPFILGDEQYVDEGLPPTSKSDEVSDIEADVAATDLNKFDATLNADLKNAGTQ